MKLSVIIVNYNVKYFLEQCLHSVEKASESVSTEVIVVDNASLDGSTAMIREKFPSVRLIENKDNLGFSKANNQAIKISNGEYVLLLNPDTLVEEDTFEKVVNFMDTHADAGGLGVKMIDGKGDFLPESKRALPTPAVSFYKIFGLSKLFPKSKIFGKYHLGYLDKEKTHQVEILSGAFMLLRKSVLDKTGLLDETFFMYGEDIDLSYRIIKAGYKNYYFPGTTIIHYKGESTKKGSINYVLVFYNAMIIFAKKHFSAKRAGFFSFFIKMAIYFRAFLSIIKRFVLRCILPVTDFLLIFLGYYLITPYWERYKFPEGGDYPDTYWFIIVPVYIIIWIISIYFSGGYEKPVKIANVARGIIIGTAVILVIYALLNLEYRFSRAMILLGAAWAFLALLSFRFVLHVFNIGQFKINFGNKKRMIIVGGADEVHRIIKLLHQTYIKPELIGFVSPKKSGNTHQTIEISNTKRKNKTTLPLIGTIKQLKEIVKINRIEEIIFSAKDISSQAIIKTMLDLSDINVDYKIAPPESLSIIGSNSINTAGDLYIVNINSIARERNRRNKRWLDIALSLLFLLMFPFFVWFIRNKSGFLRNIFLVLSANKSWVGYANTKSNIKADLPKIRPGVLSPVDVSLRKDISDRIVERTNMIYAKNYQILTDLNIIYKGYRKLGRK